MATNRTWNDEDNWWRDNFSSRPYATGRNYEDFRPGYQYGFESGQHHMGRKWNDVESDLKTGWDKFEGRRAQTAPGRTSSTPSGTPGTAMTGQQDVDTSQDERV